jgi:hypothetical protein
MRLRNSLICLTNFQYPQYPLTTAHVMKAVIKAGGVAGSAPQRG